jgi:hypothetical protein
MFGKSAAKLAIVFHICKHFRVKVFSSCSILRQITPPFCRKLPLHFAANHVAFCGIIHGVLRQNTLRFAANRGAFCR